MKFIIAPTLTDTIQRDRNLQNPSGARCVQFISMILERSLRLWVSQQINLRQHRLVEFDIENRKGYLEYDAISSCDNPFYLFEFKTTSKRSNTTKDLARKRILTDLVFGRTCHKFITITVILAPRLNKVPLSPLSKTKLKKLVSEKKSVHVYVAPGELWKLAKRNGLALDSDDKFYRKAMTFARRRFSKEKT